MSNKGFKIIILKILKRTQKNNIRKLGKQYRNKTIGSIWRPKKKIPFTKASKIIKYLRNKYKEVRDLFTGNSKTLRKEYEYTNKWKAIPCS